MNELSTDVDFWQSVREFLDGLNELTGKSTIATQLENVKLRVRFEPRDHDVLRSRFYRLTKGTGIAQAQSHKEKREHEAEQQKIDKAWGLIVKSAINNDAVLGVFLALPDAATEMPYTGLNGGERATDVEHQSKRYGDMAEHAKALLDFLATNKSGDPLQRLFSDLDQEVGRLDRVPKIRDATKMMEHTDQAIQFWQTCAQETGVRVALNFLYHAFSGANPHKWYAKQPKAKDAAKQVYTVQVAQLNRYLSKPQHSALATIANANVSKLKISSDSIRQAWAAIPHS